LGRRYCSVRVPAGIGADGGALRPFVDVAFDGMRDLQAEVAEFLAQGLPSNPKQAGRLVLIPAGVLDDKGKQESVHLTVRICVKLLRVRSEPLADERFEA